MQKLCKAFRKLKAVPFLLLSVCFFVLSYAHIAEAQRLSNGFRYAVQKRNSLPLVDIELYVEAGSRVEKEGEEGAAHLLEHLLFKGAGTYKRGEIDRAIEMLGGTLTATTSADFMRLSVTLPSAHWKRVLPLLAVLIFHPTLSPEEFDKEKRIVLDELALHSNDIIENEIARLYARFYPDHPYARVPGGTPLTISRLTLETICNFHRRNYLPSHCVFSLCGDVDSKEAENAIRQTFAEAEPTTPDRKGQSERGEEVLQSRFESGSLPSTNLVLAYRIPPAKLHRSTAIVELISELLGDENRGRLDQKRSFSPRIETRFTSRKEASLFFVLAEQERKESVLPENFVQKLGEQVLSLATKPPTREEMKTAYRGLQERFKRERGTLREVARSSGIALLTGAENTDEIEARAAAVTGSEIAQFVREYWVKPEQKTVFREMESDTSLTFRKREAAAQPLPANTTEVTLENGTRLLLTTLPDAPDLAISVFVRIPVSNDEREKALSLLVSRAAFFGSLNRTSDLVSLSVGRVGGSLEFLQTREFVAFTLHTRYRDIKEAIYLLSESLKNADFSAEALEKARQQIGREREAKQKEPHKIGEKILSERLSGKEPEDADLRRIRTQAALAYFRKHYVADRIVISVAGFFKPELVTKTFSNNFYDFERRAEKPLILEETLLPMPLIAQEEQLLPGAGAYAYLATPAPSLSSKDYPAFLILATILGGGNGSRLFSEVRDTQGFSYEVGARSLLPQTEGLFASLGWGTFRDDLTPQLAVQKIEKEFVRLMDTPPTQDEMHRAVALVAGTEMNRREKPQECAFLVGWYETLGRGFAFADTLEKTLQGVTPQEVQRVARLYFIARYSFTLAPQKPL